MIELKVGDARQRDIARGIARIDQKTMDQLGVSAGRVIEIIGKKTTAAIAWPAYAEDQHKGIIRIDYLIQKSAEAETDGIVAIERAEVKDASHITLTPADMHISVDEDFTSFVKDRLMERPFVEGDRTLVMLLGHPVHFVVTKTDPEGVVKMIYDTELQVESGPASKENLVIGEDALRRALKFMRWEKRDNTVMTRLGDEDLKQIDVLIGIGLFESRSEAVAYLTHEGIAAKREMFEQLSQKFEQISKIRDEAKALLGTSLPVPIPKTCPHCGKQNEQEAEYCNNCGEKLQ